MVNVAQKTKRSHQYGRTHVLGRIKIPIIDIKKYGGLQVAIVDGKIVAQGRTWEEVLKKAQEKSPDVPLSEIRVFSVPRSLHVIYYA